MGDYASNLIESLLLNLPSSKLLIPVEQGMWVTVWLKKKKLYVRHKIVCNEKFLAEVSPIAFSDYIDPTIKFT